MRTHKNKLKKGFSIMEELNKNTQTEETTYKVGEDGKITFTQEELDLLLQKEGDKRVTSALKKAEQKNAEKVKEAQKLAQMNEQQRYEHELEEREKAIAEKERALALAENTNVASKILAEKGLSLQLVDFVVAEDAETMNDRINRLDKAFKQSVRAEVEKRVGTGAPAKPSTPTEGMTKEQFNKLSLMEKQLIFQNQPDLYKAMTQR